MKVVLAIPIVLLLSTGCSKPAPMPESKVVPTSAATADASGVQQQVIQVGSEFSPASFNVKKGQPVRLLFKRGGEPSCADEIVFPKLNLTRKLPANSEAVVEFTPTESGELSFACGMNMMKGSVIVQ